MFADAAVRGTAAHTRLPGAAAAVLTARRASRSAALWGYIFGAVIASSAWGFVSAFPTQASRARFAAPFASNTGLAAINGPAHAIATVAGYTAWKSFMFLIIVGSVWGLLTGTRLLRGEEDAGRWELVLTGPTTPRRATAQALAGLAAGLAVLWALTAVISVIVGQLPKVHLAAGAMLFYSAAVAAPAAVFLALGALASQIAATRRQAAAYAGTVLGVCYALRMVADSGTGLSWMRWLTPLGWAEQLQPLTSPRPLVFLPLVGVVAVLACAAVFLAGQRDLGVGILPDRATSRPRTRLLWGHVGLAVRLTRPVLLGWAAAVAALALLMGSIAQQGGKALTSSTAVERVMTRFGAHGGSAAAYLGFTFVTVAWLVAFAGAGQITAMRAEEAEGRLDSVLARPVSRVSWLAARAALAAVALLAVGLLAGLAAWAGAAAESAGIGLGTLAGAGINVVPPALCVLGIGVLIIGAWPRATSAVTYGYLAWSLLIQIAGGFFGSSHWLLDTSVFHHMTAAPGVTPDWVSAAVLTAAGLAAAAVGVLAFGRRDLMAG